MRCLMHRWDKWEDVEEATKREVQPYTHIVFAIPIRVQQRRCLKCNRVERRST
jgi:hypothetical protein